MRIQNAQIQCRQETVTKYLTQPPSRFRSSELDYLFVFTSTQGHTPQTLNLRSSIVNSFAHSTIDDGSSSTQTLLSESQLKVKCSSLCSPFLESLDASEICFLVHHFLPTNDFSRDTSYGLKRKISNHHLQHRLQISRRSLFRSITFAPCDSDLAFRHFLETLRIIPPNHTIHITSSITCTFPAHTQHHTPCMICLHQPHVDETSM